MIEWFWSIWNWCVAHKDGIATFLTSSSVLGFIANIALLVKTILQVKNTNMSTAALNNTMQEHNGLVAVTNEASNEVKLLQGEIKELKTELATVTKREEVLLTKLTAMLNVQYIVYSTLKDENMRITVQNILTNAKFSEDIQKAELIEELERLRAQLEQKAKEVIESATESVEKVESVIENKVSITRF